MADRSSPHSTTAVTSLSFDPFADTYDRTRTVDKECFEAALDWLAARCPAASFPRVFEPGIGTGRIAMPLAKRGYRVVGIDIARGMLQRLAEEAPRLGRAGSVSWLVGDATAVPLKSRSFDLCIAVHLFYFIPDWRRAVSEVARLLKPNGRIVLMHTGSGMEIPALNDRYRSLCAQAGYAVPSSGVKSTKEVVSYMGESGWEAEEVRDRWSWTAQIPIREALADLEDRAYSFTSATPGPLHRSVIERLRTETVGVYSDPGSVAEVPNEIRILLLSAPLSSAEPQPGTQ